jgi:thiol-disulfide isomerase/thioredoxin
VILLLLFSATGFSDTFVLNSLTEAKNLSKKMNKPILLIFGMDSCNFCISLKKDLNSVLKKDVDNFIVCYLDVKSNQDLKKEYDINLIPDSRIILDEKTSSIIKGYRTKDYKEWLQNAK